METNTKIDKAEKEQSIDATEYRRTIGCLRYLLHTRPDISYTVGVLSRYMHDPKQSHGIALKKVLRYLKGTTMLGLVFSHQKQNLKLNRIVSNEGDRLYGFSDSSHNIDPDDGKSTTGHVFYLCECPITWCSTKQEIVALSSCEAEFMAATEAAKQAIWLQDLNREVMGRIDKTITLRIDNKSAIALAKNPVFHGRSKHIHTRFHFIRECVEKDQIKIEFVPGEAQRADILTKPLGRIKFTEMRNLLGVKNVGDYELELKGEIVEVSSSEDRTQSREDKPKGEEMQFRFEGDTG